MTDRERAIVMAYTGVVMLVGDKFGVFYQYVEEIMGRPLLTHELYVYADIIKNAAAEDFKALCAGVVPKKPELGRCAERVNQDEK